jgi:hypothetical protein
MAMNKAGSGITRRGFAAGALGTGLILGSGRTPALAQGKRDIRASTSRAGWCSTTSSMAW